MKAEIAPTTAIEQSALLKKATINAAAALGLRQQDLATVIGRDRAFFNRSAGIDPQSKTGELALLLVRAYRSLYALLGGDESNMKAWMASDNQGTGGVPAEQVATIVGLTRVVAYLDAMRGQA